MGVLDLACFAVVMATGVVSVGVGDQGLGVLSGALLWIAVAAYAVLVAVTGWRVIALRSGLWAELTDPRRAFGSFTFVAGTDVLGTRLAAAGQDRIALALLAVGCLGWLVLGYLVPAAVLRNRADRPGPVGADGTWFLWTVAVQSVAVLAATLEPVSPGLRSALAPVAIVSWAVGVFLYAVTGVLVAVRLLFRPPRPEDLTPPYWVAMGATAITALAGRASSG
ncbi:tellurite resistance/C4-dicarboxylate transporter family protein [Actinoallomurus soli]|uniref:tellurite resistance/C4-dicarboxylate transporter family protein n=1 Tax=Actinoallomurus soli TaxID=2952535 RepID=UPI0020936499|nr:tellurite resistance/C4-dicarboxylate transporter family protein [Actinoallomurus soli]MCO5967817.1 tellurite resistance/C4-dicarboxylate transporter family protein [Actinoallomurus soli]